MQCRACQAICADGEKTCSSCGERLFVPCAVCGEPIAARKRFCGECGAPLVHASGLPSSLPPPPAEHRQLTVLFCDVVSSTELATRVGPEALRALMLDYHARCSEGVERFGGYIAQYLGDGILAYFGYPTSHEDSAKRAVLAGLAIVAAMAKARTDPAQALEVRVGIHTGPVVIGEVGASDRRERLAIGQTPNVAARVQSAAAPGTVVLSEATYQLVSGDFECLSLGPLPIKGVPAPLVIHRAVRATGATRLEAAARHGLTPIVDRSAERAKVRAIWQECCNGQGALVAIIGEAGIGKSRIVREQRNLSLSQGATFLECACSPLHQHIALQPFIELLRRELGLSEANEVEARERLTRTLEPLALAHAVPALALLLAVPAQVQAPALSRRERSATLEAILAYLAARAAQRTLLLAIEDVHWADPSTLELLGLLLSRALAEHLLVLITLRPERSLSWQNPRFVTLPLSRITPADSKQLIAELVRTHVLTDATLRDVIARADGIPLYLEEITKWVLETLRLDAPTGVRTEAPPGIPPTLRDSLVARIDRLGAGKPLLQLAATLGHCFSLELLNALADLDPAALRSELERLIARGLLRRTADPDHEVYEFHHVLVEDAAYDSLLRSARQALHLRAAQALLAGRALPFETEPHLLARHFSGAGLAREAVEQWDRAGRLALARSAYAEAEAIYSKALELLAGDPEDAERDRREVALRTSLGVALVSTRGYAAPAVETNYARARALAERSGELPIGVLYGIWGVYLVRSDRDATAQLAERWDAIRLRTREPLELIVACSCMGVRAFFNGEYARSRELLAQALRQFDAHDPLAESERLRSEHGFDGYLYPHLYLSWVHSILGEPERGVATWREAMSLAERLQHPYYLVMALNFGAVLAHDFLRDDALRDELAGKEMALATEHGFPFWIATGSIHQGLGALRRGEAKRAIEQISSGVWLLAAAGAELVMPFQRVYLAQAYIADGRFAEAQALLDEIAQLPDNTLGKPVALPTALRTRGHLQLARGEVGAAEASLAAAGELARTLGNRWLELDVAIERARLLHARAEASQARALLSPLLAAYPASADNALVRAARALLEHGEA